MKKIMILEALQQISESFESFLKLKLRDPSDVSFVTVSKEQYEGDIESFLLKEAPDILFVPNRLSRWHNPKYGGTGIKLTSFIKKNLPNTLVVFTSVGVSSERERQLMLSSGADIVCQKGDIDEHLNEIEDHLSKF